MIRTADTITPAEITSLADSVPTSSQLFRDCQAALDVGGDYTPYDQRAGLEACAAAWNTQYRPVAIRTPTTVCCRCCNKVPSFPQDKDIAIAHVLLDGTPCTDGDFYQTSEAERLNNLSHMELD